MTCGQRGPWGETCSDRPGHDYSHYDGSADVSWNDHPGDHRDECQCTACTEWPHPATCLCWKCQPPLLEPGDHVVHPEHGNGLVVHVTDQQVRVITAAPFVLGALVYRLHSIDGWRPA